MPIVTFPSLFAVMADPENLVLAQAIANTFPDNYIPIRPGQWFLASVGTAKDVSDRLGVTVGGASGPAVVVAVSGYYGRASTQVWEWICSEDRKADKCLGPLEKAHLLKKARLQRLLTFQKSLPRKHILLEITVTL